MAFSVVQELGVFVTSDSPSICFGTDIGADADTGVNATAGNSILACWYGTNGTTLTNVIDNVDSTAYSLELTAARTGDREQQWFLFNDITGGATTVTFNLPSSILTRAWIFEISSDNNDLQVEDTDTAFSDTAVATLSTSTGITTAGATLVFSGCGTDSDQSSNTVPSGFTTPSSAAHYGSRMWAAYKEETALTGQTYTWDPNTNDEGTVAVLALRDGDPVAGGIIPQAMHNYKQQQ